MIRVLCDRHGIEVGGAGALTLRLKFGALSDGRCRIDLCESCAAEFRAWLGERAAPVVIAGDPRLEGEP